ncbi:bifunctional [glutamine synthetase] adenylyltransferase/[glutamine synthetase]-adenylyl-L-tyrosine phosphorylase [Brachybacterium hainanense]|uniref:Bifunctional [glutamine synthetase] adenylyltransferase/[glutamine synthetase]-adenylyl-L-tyrosine phosphorylase n=1 Tax=Brachybacterium hainanense TaxID=1541174 RepID=A0ABV6REF2_9MICO
MPPLTHAELVRLGFARADRVERFLADPLLDPAPRELIEAMARSADPDEAAIGLLRLVEAMHRDDLAEQARAILVDASGQDLVRLLGASVAIGDHLTRHPETVRPLLTGAEEPLTSAAQYRERILRAVGADPAAAVPVASGTGDALRTAYFASLAGIAFADLTAEDPLALQVPVSAALADLAAAALEGALALARASQPGHEHVRLSILAMGKTGARELNYISDVDVLYVVAPAAPEVDAEELTRIGGALARQVARICSERTAEGSLWQVDANLRPEGKDGELVRTIDSYRRYYERWADSWEFQALLKARPVAGDEDLGAEFVDLVQPMVWQASTRDGFVDDTRAMRRRVVELIPHGETERNVKLGPGGLRDVEFTVQLLQMVHGRSDEELRCRGTLEALARLRAGGYVSRAQADEMDEAYRFLRVVEHRIQLHRLRRSQVIPEAPADLRRLARSAGMGPEDFTRRVGSVRRRVRQLHEEIFYRPLLQTAAGLSDGEVRLSPASAQARLAAIGYRDPVKATQHIAALTGGVSRSAAIQRQLLPALLEWFADGIAPDMGLLAFRRLSEEAGSTHWFLGMLRDSGVAAKRLTRVLSSSRYAGDQLVAMPHTTRWLSRDDDLRPLGSRKLGEELTASMRRAGTREEAVGVVRDIRRREITRLALSRLSERITAIEVGTALTDLADAELAAALDLALRDEESAGIRMAVIALGSFGAREMGYASDADVQFVVEDAGAGPEAVARGIRVATALQKILNAPSAGMDMKVNADLRPEGRQGALVRSIDSWLDYYRRHAAPWELQALLRARVSVGPSGLAERLEQELDALRYPREGMTAARERDFVRMKARIESERLPRGITPERHLKLGRGAMTDVEWVVQKLQIAHAGENPDLRRISTLPALEAIAAAGLLSSRDAEILAEAWLLAWRLRRALFLWKGREPDALPSDRVDRRALALLVEGPDGSANSLEERYLRITRQARAIVEREIFGASTPHLPGERLG